MARYFDAVDDVINCADSASLRSPATAITMAAWHRPSSASNSDAWSGIISKERTAASQPYTSYEIGHTDVARTFFAEITFDDSTRISTPSTAVITGDVWHFFVSRWASGGKISLNVYNSLGALVDAQESAGTKAGNLGYTNLQFKVGATTWAYLRGHVANVYVHNQSLSDNEVLALMRGFIPQRPSAILLPIWGVNSPERDISGNGNHGTITGAIRVPPPYSPWMHSEYHAKARSKRAGFTPRLII